MASDTNTQNANRPAAAASPTATAAAAAQPAKNTNANAKEVVNESKGDVTGAYFAAGTLPGDFSEIEHLSLATIDENGNPAPLNGFIRPKRRSAKDYQLVNPKLNGRNLTFTTATVGGVGYSFTGTFEKLDNFSANPPPSDEVILRGTLKKTQDGEVVAETKVNFTYSAGG
ncbi:MAG TPA: hypothetical protein VGC66_24490 [Pyrinomonadaceae bacterium]